MSRIPCGHSPLLPGCPFCELAAGKSKYRYYWGVQSGELSQMPLPVKSKKAWAPLRFTPLPCIHRGAPTGETRPCPTCTKKDATVNLYHCDKHGTCTVDKLAKGEPVQCCKLCPDFQAAANKPTVRNLLYHIAPATGNGVWQRNVEQLLQRIGLFNGRRVVAIVTGEAKRTDYKADFELDPPEDVMAMFKGHVHEFIVLPNNPRLREVVTFVPLLERVAVTDQNQVTFYAHAKGVTRPVNDGVTVHRWTEILYETCLDYWPLVEQQLAQYPIVGSFKKPGYGFVISNKPLVRSESSWHYSGSFYWLRNAGVFERDWRRVDNAWWGNESWPGLHFQPSEAGVLFHEERGMNLFSMPYLRHVVEPAYANWKKVNAKWRQSCLMASS